MNKSIHWPILTALLLIASVSIHCAEGQGPETVVVPAGDPQDTGQDPYERGSDFGCGGIKSGEGAVSIHPADEHEGRRRVLVTLLGSRDIFFFLMTVDELAAAAAELIPLLPEAGIDEVDKAEVDRLRLEYCAPDSEPRRLEDDLRELLIDVLGTERVTELEGGICD